MLKTGVALAMGMIVVLGACGESPPADRDTTVDEGTSGTLEASEPARSAQAAPVEVPLLAVGDIAVCDRPYDNKVAAFVRSRSARVATLGDTVYNSGTHAEFAECWEPHWGS